MASTNKIVVIGGGVIGLTTAYLLSKDKSNEITVAAKHMPGDYDIEYCSMWAGANFLPDEYFVSPWYSVGAEGSAHARWETNTWPVLEDLAQNHPEAGIHFQKSVVINRKKDAESATGLWFKELLRPDPWYKDIVPDFKLAADCDLKPEVDNEASFTSVCMNAPVYLSWLVSQCCKNGVVFKRATFKHISEAATVHASGQKPDLIVNCTGLGSLKLGGVQDSKMYPARGQVVVVRNDPGAMYSLSGCDDGDDEACYIMMRAAGGGTILGGSYQINSWDSQPEPSLAVRIMKRCIEVCPQLVGKDENGKQRGIEGLDIIRHGVGLRPLRHGGTRVEKDNIDGTAVVHNYGHGGFGYQTSFGCCAEAAALAKEALAEIKPKARL
ncbi:uncharacterized protein GIQ15_02438 [Arthroderma uncinatum]|uniref:uncharacterized protein n=1 Tax=Arthroderma uncinatum TaxID=74035 RepID=UPI00144AA06F|nr:uncharacterized protein GIQ15_02438 [Arthroderma uncinatum]KAF3483114.1 hypothetical protein GIQ15_02438 [Arthroderma uncinatum]